MMGYQSKANLVKDEKGDILADYHERMKRWKKITPVRLWMYPSFNKNQGLKILKVCNQNWCKCTAGIIIPGTCSFLVFVPVKLFSISN